VQPFAQSELAEPPSAPFELPPLPAGDAALTAASPGTYVEIGDAGPARVVAAGGAWFC
jgi:hypothetical protein